MKILVTNDDGISADGLWLLVRELTSIAEVVVVASDREQSAAGTAVTLWQPLRIRKVRPAVPGVETFAVEGTPADSVLLALGSLVLSLGGKTFVYRLFYWFVPGFNLFRSQERAIYLTSYALAVLAGYGWHWLSSGRAGRTQIRWGLWGVTALGVASVAATAVVWAVGRQQPLSACGGSQSAAWLKRLLLWVGLTWAGWGLVRLLGGDMQRMEGVLRRVWVE